jgi:outer membrane protein assembly factor BamB
MADTPLVFVATGRKVAAYDRHTGRPVWQVRLPRVMAGPVSMLLPSGRELFVGRAGYIYCLDASNGQVLWERGAASSGFVLIATPDAVGASKQQAAMVQQLRDQEAAAAAAAS